MQMARDMHMHVHVLNMVYMCCEVISDNSELNLGDKGHSTPL